MKQMLKDTLILFVITLISGLALGAVYMVTKEPIERQNEKKKAKAYQIVFDDAASFEDEEGFEPTTILEGVGGEDYSDNEIMMFASAYDANDNLIGYVITVTSHAGFAGDITFSMGIRLDGTLNGISITEISETAGLGMRASEVLVPQFAGKMTDSSFTVTKMGATYPTEIDAISGATITSEALTNGVNAGIEYFQYRMFLKENAEQSDLMEEGGTEDE